MAKMDADVPPPWRQRMLGRSFPDGVLLGWWIFIVMMLMVMGFDGVGGMWC